MNRLDEMAEEWMKKNHGSYDRNFDHFLAQDAFKAGYEAAVADAQVLVDALEFYQVHAEALDAFSEDPCSNANKALVAWQEMQK
jgi:hypothetical protein